MKGDFFFLTSTLNINHSIYLECKDDVENNCDFCVQAQRPPELTSSKTEQTQQCISITWESL